MGRSRNKGRTRNPYNTDANRKACVLSRSWFADRAIPEEEGLPARQPVQDRKNPIELEKNYKHRCRRYFQRRGFCRGWIPVFKTKPPRIRGRDQKTQQSLGRPCQGEASLDRTRDS